MTRKTRILLLLCAAIFLSGVLGCVWVLNRPRGTWVEILQDGSLIQRIDLSQARDQNIDVEYEGRSNRITIENGRIRVSQADCPDHICVDRGWLDSSIPIVCLPNRLVIQYTDQGANIDALAQ